MVLEQPFGLEPLASISLADGLAECERCSIGTMAFAFAEVSSQHPGLCPCGVTGMRGSAALAERGVKFVVERVG
jgi:hypothetical protein